MLLECCLELYPWKVSSASPVAENSASYTANFHDSMPWRFVGHTPWTRRLNLNRRAHGAHTYEQPGLSQRAQAVNHATESDLLCRGGRDGVAVHSENTSAEFYPSFLC